MSQYRETNGREKTVGQYIDFGLYWESVENFEDKWDIIFLFCKKITPAVVRKRYKEVKIRVHGKYQE